MKPLTSPCAPLPLLALVLFLAGPPALLRAEAPANVVVFFVDDLGYADIGCYGNHAIYAGMVEAMDAAVGTVLDRLESLGLDERTLVIFTSDNGGLSTSEGHPTSNLPLRAGKGWLYEGGIRVPLIARWSGTIEAGMIVETPATTIDLYPTILNAAGLEPAPEQTLDGVDLLAHLRSDGVPEERDLFWHFPHYGNQGGFPGSVIRRGEHKLIELFEDGSLELYNLSADTGEERDLAAAKPELAAELHEALKQWRADVGAELPVPNPNHDPAQSPDHAAQFPHAAPMQKPNIVILYADDLGYGDLGCYNPESRIPTPHLDRLAAEGLRFTDGHSSSGVCTPSRYALLTGRAHWRDFHWIDRGFDPPFFKPDQLTMGGMLREKGYATACIGKWHLGNDWDSIRKPGTPEDSIEHADFDWSKPLRGGANDHGFDYYFGDNVINFPPYTWLENGRVLEVPDMTYSREDFVRLHGSPPEGGWECRPGPGRSDWDFYKVLPTLTEKAVEYIHSRKDEPEPFFLYFPLPSPHTPIVPNKEFEGTSEAGPYGDFVVETDWSCGQLLEALRETGLDANTIVIFTADNGSEYFAYARDQNFGHWSSEPLRGLKRDVYEGGHRVPTIIKWPGVTEPGAVSDALFAQTDLMATFAGYLGFDLPRDSAEDSYDFWPYLSGSAEEPPRTSMVHNTMADQYAIRDGHWLLMDHATGVVGGDGRQPPPAWMEKHGVPPYAPSQQLGLYDLSEDIGQRFNLAEEQPERVAEMQALLGQIRERGHSAPRLQNTKQ